MSGSTFNSVPGLSRAALPLAAGGAGLLVAASLLPKRGRRRIQLAGGGAMAAAGALWSAHAWSERTASDREPRDLLIRHSVTVQTAADDLYRLWCDPATQAQLGTRVKVEILEAGRWRWQRKIPGNRRVEWETETTEDRPPHRFSWRSLPSQPEGSEGARTGARWRQPLHPPFQILGTVEFAAVTPPPEPLASPAPLSDAKAGPPAATELRLHLRFSPWAGRDDAERFSRRLFPFMQGAVERGVANRLFRLKQLAETGEIATTRGQPSGRRSVAIRTLEPFDQPESFPHRLRGVG